MSIFKEFFNYVLSPSYLKDSTLPHARALKELSLLFVAEYFFKLAWLFLVNKNLRSWFPIERSEIAEGAAPEQDSLLWFFVTVAIFYPVAEELIFRYFLKGKKIISFMAVGLFLGGMTYWVLKGFDYPSLGFKRAVLVLGGLLPLVLVIGSYVRASKRNSLETNWSRIFPVLFYLSTVGFAALHIANYSWEGHYWIILPFVVPQLVSGFLYGFSRMKYGMWACILLHSMSNALTFVFDQLLGW